MLLKMVGPSLRGSAATLYTETKDIFEVRGKIPVATLNPKP